MRKADVKRISPEEAHRLVAAGKALLVCAYEGDETFQSMRLEGAISLNQLMDRMPVISTDQRIIFYCS